MKFETILKYYEWYLCQISRPKHTINTVLILLPANSLQFPHVSWNTTALSQSNWINFSCKYNVVKTTRSLRATWNSRNTLFSLRKGFQVVYLFECMKTREPCTICQGVEIQLQRYNTDKGKKFPLNGGCFRKWISTYHSSCYRIESKTTCCTKKNSHDLRACVEKAYVVVTYSG